MTGLIADEKMIGALFGEVDKAQTPGFTRIETHLDIVGGRSSGRASCGILQFMVVQRSCLHFTTKSQLRRSYRFRYLFNDLHTDVWLMRFSSSSCELEHRHHHFDRIG